MAIEKDEETGFLWMDLEGASLDKAMALGPEAAGLAKGVKVRIVIDPKNGPHVFLENTTPMSKVSNNAKKGVARLVS